MQRCCVQDYRSNICAHVTLVADPVWHRVVEWKCMSGLQANESRSMRGMKRLASDAAARFKQQQTANGQGPDDTAHGVNPVNGNAATGFATRNGV